MTYPPAPLGTTYANATSTDNLHPAAHNLANAAINDTVDILGTAPQGDSLTVEARQAGIEQGADGYRERKLFGWWEALYTGNGRVLVVGDSNAEGSADLATMSERWINLTTAQVRARQPVVGGNNNPDGYVPVFYVGADVPGPSLTMTGHWSQNIAVGMGKRAARLQSDTGGGVGMAAYTFEGTHFAIQWTGVDNGGKSEYRIDGGAWVELDQDDGNLFLRDHLTAPIDCGGRASHTVECRYKSSGTAPGANADPHIGGFWLIDADDPTAGITLFDAAHAGFLVSNYNAFPGYLIGDWVDMTDADLLIIHLGINEWQQSTPATIDADVADYTTQLETLIATARTNKPELQVMLRGGWTPLDSPGPAVPADWPKFLAAQYAVAAADPYTSVFDSGAAIPQADGPGDDGTFWDTYAIHMVVNGHAAYASQLADFLALPADGAYADPGDTWHFVGDVGEPPFENSWDNGGVSTEACFRLTDGRVYVSGSLTGGALGDPVWTMPPGYRPSETAYLFVGAAGGTASFVLTTVDPDGTVTPLNDGSGSTFLIAFAGATNYSLDPPPATGS